MYPPNKISCMRLIDSYRKGSKPRLTDLAQIVFQQPADLLAEISINLLLSHIVLVKGFRALWILDIRNNRC